MSKGNGIMGNGHGGNTETPDRPWVDFREAMRICGVSRRTLYNWIAKGKITTMRTPGGSQRFQRSDLLRPGQPLAAAPVPTPTPSLLHV
jgi:excisionase family DNA binding protein